MQVNASKGIGKGNNSFNLQELSEPRGMKYTLTVFLFPLTMFLKKIKLNENWICNMVL
jgi:hypothetical protein